MILEAIFLFLSLLRTTEFHCLDDASNLSLTASLFDWQAFIRCGSPDVSTTLFFH